MNTSKNYSPGPFAVIFAWIGMIAGGAAGFQANGFMGMLTGGIILAVIGVWIGRLADAVLSWVMFVVVSIVILLINAAVRNVILSMIFGGSS